MLELFKHLVVDWKSDDCEEQAKVNDEFFYGVMNNDNPETEIVSSTTSRRSDNWDHYTEQTIVFSYKGRFFSFTINVDSWEDDGRFGDTNLPEDLKEVFPVQRMVTVYE